ncbi:hypothetical protein Tco_0030687 [Tanacetum coccineum]
MWTNVANIPSFVPKAASVPADSRNRQTSVPAGSRNEPASVPTDSRNRQTFVPAGSRNRPTSMFLLDLMDINKMTDMLEPEESGVG